MVTDIIVTLTIRLIVTLLKTILFATLTANFSKLSNLVNKII